MTAPQPWPPHCQLWPVDADCRLPQGWTADPLTWPPAQRRAVMLASEHLYYATGKAYGLCMVHMRPCRLRCTETTAAPTGPLNPVLWNGSVVNAVGCGCVGSCGCAPVCEVLLDGPVAGIVRVTVDGQPVPDSTYRVDDHHRLVRQGGGCWPHCQAMHLPDGEPGTWSIVYWRGRDISPRGRLAVTLLAIEYNKLCTGDASCVLPERVTQLTRQGVTYTLENTPRETGVKVVDDWVNMVNPYGLTEPGMAVYSPDTMPAGRYQTWPTPQYVFDDATALGLAPRINVHHVQPGVIGIIADPTPPQGGLPDFHVHPNDEGPNSITVEVQP